MKIGFFLRLLICILFLGGCLYSYLNLQNSITELRIRIPELSREVRRINEENTHLCYEIDMFESPENLMKIAKKDAFSHLRFPVDQAVVRLTQAPQLNPVGEEEKQKRHRKTTIHLAAGEY